MNDEVMLKRRPNKTEQKNRIKTASSDFLTINRMKGEKKK